jgi:hypothetical protein
MNLGVVMLYGRSWSLGSRGRAGPRAVPGEGGEGGGPDPVLTLQPESELRRRSATRVARLATHVDEQCHHRFTAR